MLDRARSGASAVLAISGEAGSGKSALIADTVERATDFRRLETRGVESEAEFAFSGLHDLLGPILDHRAQLPETQRAALEGALALGPSGGGDALGIAAATLAMISTAAETDPLLLVVEDLHWLDAASAEAILFSLRRLQEDRVAALLAVRPPAESIVKALPTMELGGVDAEDASQLLAARFPDLDSEVVEGLHGATGGNPLALLQAPALLSDAQRAGDEPLQGPLPVDETVERAFRVQLEALSEAAGRAIVVAAAADTNTPVSVVLAALEKVGLGEAALDEVEDAEMIEVGQAGFSFPHPLFRSAAYQSGRRSWARAAHRALGEALIESGRNDAAAWQLAAAARGPEEDVARALEKAAATQRERGGHRAAGWAMKRAAELSMSPRARAARRLSAARDLRLAGRIPAALALIEEIDHDELSFELRFSLEMLRGQIEGWRSPLREVHDALVGFAEEIAPEHPEKAALLMNEAALPHLRTGDVIVGLQAAQRACELGRGTPAEKPTVLTRSVALVLAGSAPAARAAIEGFAAEIEADETTWGPTTLYQLVPRALMWLGDYRRARALARRFIERSGGVAPGALPVVLATLGEVAFRNAEFVEARAYSAEAASLARDTQQPVARAFALAGLARVDAVVGTEKRCREHAGEARAIGERLGSGSPIVEFGGSALGFLELSLGRPEAAIKPLWALREMCSARGLAEPAMVQFAPNLVEALARVGRTEDAYAELAALESAAETSEGAWAQASAARCRGLVDPEFEPLFQSAIERFEDLGLRFDLARTQLCFGERLRRERRRAAARERLRRAEDEFTAMGAERWADRARAEIGVSGQKARRRSEPRSDELTSQELQVALIVAEGATNKEAGARLFLSAKTIESHLGRIYRKLGIRSRTELAALVSSGGLRPGAA